MPSTAIHLFTSFVFVHIFMNIDAELPNGDELCNVIVDKKKELECHVCFNNAGITDENLSNYAQCMNIHLPSILSHCSFIDNDPPEERDMLRMGQDLPDYHSRLNTNTLSICLRRRKRLLDAYLTMENHFVAHAQKYFDTVEKYSGKKLIEPFMDVLSQREILSKPFMKKMVSSLDKSCDIEIFKNVYSEYYISNEGNRFPVNGFGPIAEELLFGLCLIHTLINADQGTKILDYLTHDSSYMPIPTSWILPLLRIVQHTE